MSNVQKMHNDLERSGENDRRRLESQIQMLEHQSQDLRDQLGRERETVRRVTLQREVEAKELRTAVDTQAQELAKTRESLIGAETSKKHFEERVLELTRRLQGDEEKLAVYERRSSAINGVAHRDNAPDLTREQQLEAEVAELRSSLKVAQLDLANARSNVQQFQEISQANEEALATLSATYDEYKASTEAQITNSEAERDVLQKRLDSLTQELQKSQEALAESQRILDTERDAWENDKKTLEDTIVDLTTAEKNVADDRTSRDAEVHAQEERVKAAEERYSREVVAHAESIKAIEELKKRLAVLQASARENLTNAETAQAKLSASEASWGQQRQALDREIADLAARCKALTEQNNVLHQHLDSVSSQAARIREAANATPRSSSDVDPSEDSDTKLSELRAVITYLRKEKEIVDMQYELSKQENARLKAQIGHLTHDLEETRATLSEERERAVSSAATDAQHAELVEKIQQLNLLRESNATLRADSEAHAKRARDLDIQVKLLTVELEPLRERERILQADLDAQKGHVSRLEDESRKWQQRNSQLLSKYDRIDPAEVQALRNEIEALKAEKVAWETSTSTNSDESSAQQAKIAELEKTLQDTKAAHQRQMGQFKQRIGEMNGQQSRLTSSFNESQAQLKAVMAERDALKASGSGSGSDPSKQLADELEKLRAEKTRLEHALENEKKKPVPVSTNPDQEAKIVSMCNHIDSATVDLPYSLSSQRNEINCLLRRLPGRKHQHQQVLMRSKQSQSGRQKRQNCLEAVTRLLLKPR
ncbi:hypothetical protein BV25DRAFT_683663 [Artomyces pyxidatus]|uniref:Uncharacterized protein n=1 Tax=Artomyces pyxidatus TaxID=48021 RepID=A0ACB8T0T8_9AGAM|nr:hypothetical protein BV25DRAFT_683663 [Artomyces pyxidatus]